jgi:hypothetical protein
MRESTQELNVTNTLKHCHVAAWSASLRKRVVRGCATGDKEVDHLMEGADKRWYPVRCNSVTETFEECGVKWKTTWEKRKNKHLFL